MTRTLGRASAALVALVLPLALTATVAAPAEAAGGCVSKAEFRKAKKQMTTKKVHRIFGTKGKQSFVFDGYQSREYKTCTSQYGFVMVDFERGKLTSKMAFWG
jgi:hypothetical protein